MAPTNAFLGMSRRPTEADLRKELGASKDVWDRLVGDLSTEHGLTLDWGSSSKKAGWSLRLKRGERKIVYLSPFHGCFGASFALGDKAVQAARKSGLPQKALAIIDRARKYAEGTGVRIEVQGPEDLVIVKKLAAIKLDN
jgi:uncharacterized protein DUF3788